MSVTEFLLARIAEDEAVARAAMEMMKGPSWANDGTCVASGEDAFWVDGLHVRSPELVAEHIVRHDPARILAECAAKRAIVERYWAYANAAAEHESVGIAWIGDRSSQVVMDEVIRTLAAVYADHQDYSPEWKVGA